MKIIFVSMILTSLCWADQYGYLSDKDQPYFKNEQLAGNNERERVDLNVKEINKLHAEVAKLREEVNQLKLQMDASKSGKK